MKDFIEITDFQDPELDVFARLTEAQLLNRFEPKKGMFIAESPKVIQRALAAGCRPEKLLVERGHCNREAMEAIEACGDVPVYTAPLPVLAQLTGFQLTRGMLCAMYRPPLRCAGDVLKDARRVAVLEDVMNPTNLGGDLPLRRRPEHGRGAAHPCLHRSALPPLCPGEHGHGLPGALGISGGRLAGAAPCPWLQDCRHGADG